MVIPVGRPGHPQVLMRVDKDAEGRVTERPLMGVQYVPLVREEL
jgi:protein-L-isoaspartate O-methyltransferase